VLSCVFIIFSYQVSLKQIRLVNLASKLGLIFLGVAGTLTTIAYKLSQAFLLNIELIDGVTLARLSFLFLLSGFLLSFYFSWANRYPICLASEFIFHFFPVVLILISKVHNAGLFGVFFLIGKILRSSLSHLENPNYLSFIPKAFAQAAFFFVGNSNSISTVDIASAYTGLTEYNMVSVGILLFLLTWGPSVFFLFISYLVARDKIPQNPVKSGKLITADVMFAVKKYVMFQMWVSTFYSLIMIAMKNHLFIWTVFSPKFLYQIFWLIAATVNFALHWICAKCLL